jgi:hypothetical protein
MKRALHRIENKTTKETRNAGTKGVGCETRQTTIGVKPGHLVIDQLLPSVRRRGMVPEVA